MATVPALLKDRPFRGYWTAQTVSLFGDQVSSVAMPLTAVLVFKASAAEMGYLTALIWLPSLLFGLHAGAWVDRRGRRRATMIAADAGRFALFASVPVGYALGVLTLAQLYAVAFAAGGRRSSGPSCARSRPSTSSTWASWHCSRSTRYATCT
ncbi:MAG TPA: hypothetical protein VMC03_05990 [Streptosporangiaceae bacterium]|nr:hypothetical protein [Streptosporangiaceae bacterium]